MSNLHLTNFQEAIENLIELSGEKYLTDAEITFTHWAWANIGNARAVFNQIITARRGGTSVHPALSMALYIERQNAEDEGYGGIF
jgi:hypothetical protein